MIPPDFLQDLLSRVDIVEVVGRHVELRKSGANHMGLCPFHGEKSPSFSVSAAKQFYHCFGCGVHGDAIRFLMEHTGMGFRDAVADLAQQVGMAVPDDGPLDAEQQQRALQARAHQATLSGMLERAAEHYRRQLKESPQAIDYLKRRGLSGEVARRFGLGYAPAGWHGLASAFPRYDDPLLAESGLVIAHEAEGDGEAKRYDRFRDRIMFPIRSVQGEVIGFGGRVLGEGEPKYLNSPETPVFVKGRELYGLHEARAALRQRGFALVVEGYMDVVALAQLGFPNAVATLGTACTAEHVQKLFRFTDSVVFSFDGDAAGRKAAGRALEAALPHASDTRSVRFLFLPPEHDPDSFVRAQGAAAFERLIAQAVPLSRQLVEAAREGCDMASAEGRARLLANARPMWNALPEGALKRQLLAEIAQAGALPGAELADLWQVGRAAAAGSSMAPRPLRPAPRTARLRAAPASRADHALRMLLLHSEWWDALEPADHELLHALPGPHGALCAWLERHLSDHGATPWSALDAAISGSEHAGLAARLVTEHALADEMTVSELRSVVDRMWIEHIAAEMGELSRVAETDAAARARLRELAVEQERRRRRADPVSPVAASAKL